MAISDDEPRFDADPVVWATWLYYGEGRTQAETASALGVSRATVANHLAEARKRGLVRIELAPDLLARAELARLARERYGLAEVLIAPSLGEDAAARRARLGAAGAQALIHGLLPERGALGVAWGRTVAALAAALPTRAMAGLEVVQLSGSSQGGAEDVSPEGCTLSIAAKLGARVRHFHAPAVVSNRALRDALLDEPAIARHFERARGADLALFGVGELASGDGWADAELQVAPAMAAYRAAGAIGVVLGRFVDADGREVRGPLDGRQIGLALEDLAKIPLRLCVAGGREKRAAIRAALRAGHATHLVTDAETARALASDPERG